MSAGSEFSLEGRRVWVAGHGGMVGQALCRRLAQEPCRVITADRRALDLRDQKAVTAWLQAARPDLVYVAAARVGGILANDRNPGRFLYDNLMIAANCIEAARRADVAKLVFLGSTCVYPRNAPQPIPESAMLSGPLEPTNQWYAVAKIAGIKLCDAYRRDYGCDFISVQPTNLYGPGDNFDLTGSHVLAALMRKIHEAKALAAPAVPIWGTGRPKREFLHVDDLADALVFLARTYSAEGPINVGTGEEISIDALARMLAEVIGYQGGFIYETDKPDGVARKLCDSRRLAALGWRPRVDLRAGLAATYAWFTAQGAGYRGRDPKPDPDHDRDTLTAAP